MDTLGIADLNEKEFSDALNSSVTIYRHLSQKQYGAMFNELENLLGKLNSPKFTVVQELKKYG